MFGTKIADPKSVASIILGGGAGTQLFPLTSTRATPAVREILILSLFFFWIVLMDLFWFLFFL